jgi:hypothetical protein
MDNHTSLKINMDGTPYVNAKLGKPEITIEEAYSIWRKNDGMEYKETTKERS